MMPRQVSANGKGTRILIIEDNSDMRDFLRRVLAHRGYQLLEAADGLEGITLAARELPDLILMDISLPALDGLEATRQLKANTALAHIPVVAVTAHARTSDELRAREAGCDDYISKPYGLHEFLQMVEKYTTAST